MKKVTKNQTLIMAQANTWVEFCINALAEGMTFENSNITKKMNAFGVLNMSALKKFAEFLVETKKEDQTINDAFHTRLDVNTIKDENEKLAIESVERLRTQLLYLNKEAKYPTSILRYIGLEAK